MGPSLMVVSFGEVCISTASLIPRNVLLIYIQLLCSGKEGEFGQEDDYILSNPYHLVIIITL